MIFSYTKIPYKIKKLKSFYQSNNVTTIRKTMVYVTLEESIEIIRGFMKYAFDEMSSNGEWGLRRNELLEQQNISLHQDVAVLYTFQEMAELYHGGDLDVALTKVFVNEITSKTGWKWLEAWVYENYPALDTREDGIICWDMWKAMEQMLDHNEEELVNELREILELNLYLK